MRSSEGDDSSDDEEDVPGPPQLIPPDSESDEEEDSQRPEAFLPVARPKAFVPIANDLQSLLDLLKDDEDSDDCSIECPTGGAIGPEHKKTFALQGYE